MTRVPLPGPDGPVEAGPDPEPLSRNRRPVGALPIEVDVAAILERGAGRGRAPSPTRRASRRSARRTPGTTLPRGVRRLALLAPRRAGAPLRRRRAARGEAGARAARGAPRARAGGGAAPPRRARRRARGGRPPAAGRLGGGSAPPLRPRRRRAAPPARAGRRARAEGAASSERFDADEVVARFESGEWLPSFSALSRPLAASMLYPVAATVLGPAELAYWAQMLPLFDWAGVVPPVLVPRPMAAPVTAAGPPAPREARDRPRRPLRRDRRPPRGARRRARGGAPRTTSPRSATRALAGLAALAPRLVGRRGRAREAARGDARERPLLPREADREDPRRRGAGERGRGPAASPARRRARSRGAVPPNGSTRRSRGSSATAARASSARSRSSSAGTWRGCRRSRCERYGTRSRSWPSGRTPTTSSSGAAGRSPSSPAAGCRVGILDLTRGEAGTRGTPETRAAEAAESARILGALFRDGLDLGDGNLRTDRAAELEVIEVIRRRRPRLVFAPLAVDRHPDHVRAGRLVTDAAFYAGLRALETGRAAAPAAAGRLLPLDVPRRADVPRRRDRGPRDEARRRPRVPEPVLRPGVEGARDLHLLAASSSTGSRRGRARSGVSRTSVLRRGSSPRGRRCSPIRSRPSTASSRGSEPMKIGIACYPTFGGSGVVATELGHELARRGHDVHFISYALPSRLNLFAERVSYHEVTVPTYPLFTYPPYDLALATRIVDVALHEGLDIIHAHYALPHAISAHLAREMLLPRRLAVVTTLHGTDVTIVGQDRSYLPITRFGIERSDAVTAVSEYLAPRDARGLHAAPGRSTSSRTSSTPTAGGPTTARGAPPASPGAGSGSSSTSRTSGPSSGSSTSSRSSTACAATVPSRLLMVGDGPDRPAAEALCREKGISGLVHFLGNTPAVSGADAGGRPLRPDDGHGVVRPLGPRGAGVRRPGPRLSRGRASRGRRERDRPASSGRWATSTASPPPASGLLKDDRAWGAASRRRAGPAPSRSSTPTRSSAATSRSTSASWRRRRRARAS